MAPSSSSLPKTHKRPHDFFLPSDQNFTPARSRLSMSSNGLANNENFYRISYTLPKLDHFCTSCKNLRRSIDECADAKASLEKTLQETSYARKQKTLVQQANIKLVHLREKLKNEQLKLAEKERQYKSNQCLIDERKDEESARITRLHELSRRVAEEKEKIETTRTSLSNIKETLDKRRASLVKELCEYSFIINLDNESCPSINGFRLPVCRPNIVQSSSSWSWFPSRRGDISDIEKSIAIGHAVHLLLSLSKLMDIPLKYQMIYWGSQSLIVDHLKINAWSQISSLPNGPGNGVSVALHITRARDSKLIFDYGVYLLNQSIIQLKWTSEKIFNVPKDPTCKIDASQTLKNLNDILKIYIYRVQ